MKPQEKWNILNKLKAGIIGIAAACMMIAPVAVSNAAPAVEAPVVSVAQKGNIPPLIYICYRNGQAVSGRFSWFVVVNLQFAGWRCYQV